MLSTGEKLYYFDIPINRISIIGGSGSGKSTLANILSKELDIPAIHLDSINYNANWVEIDKNERDKIISSKANEDKWIIEGNYNKTLKERLERADLIIWLDYSSFAHLKGVCKRIVKNYNKEKPDIPGCKERLNFTFLKYVMTYNKEKRPKVIELLKDIPDEKRRQIKIGDKIEFSKLPELQEIILVDVLDLYKEETFENLFKKLYSDEEEIKRKTNSMYQYYSPEKEKEYGVIGIKISLISSGFRYTYNKLVRDKIPENIDSELGRKSKYRILNDKEYLTELNRKVLEEANEFIEENSIEELADLMEVINSIMKLKGYKMEEVHKVMKAKTDKKGAFNDKIYLEYVDEQKRNVEEEKKLNKESRKD